jgi:hypothetical protein
MSGSNKCYPSMSPRRDAEVVVRHIPGNLCESVSCNSMYSSRAPGRSRLLQVAQARTTASAPSGPRRLKGPVYSVDVLNMRSDWIDSHFQLPTTSVGVPLRFGLQNGGGFAFVPLRLAGLFIFDLKSVALGCGAVPEVARRIKPVGWGQCVFHARARSTPSSNRKRVAK